MQDLSVKILSDITTYMKYARYIPELKRRETWEEIVDRNKQMHLETYPQLKDEIEYAYGFVKNKIVLPSMRTLQFAGKPIEINHARGYNCAFAPVDDWRIFSEAMFLLLGGTGFGYSVQRRHVDKLPEVRKPTKTRRYLVGDSIEGWADAVKILIRAYLDNGALPKFDFRDIRPKGARLVTSGGKAPGPEPLKDCLHNIQKIFDRKESGEKLSSLDCHHIMTYIADCVLAGGIRRAALISLFDYDDKEMTECKYGNWWETNPHFGRANNSAVFLRSKLTKEVFYEYFEKMKNSGSGDPGFYLTNNYDMLCNPCQPSWAPVLKKTGISTIGSIANGDEIWSENGWVKVVKKWSTGVKKVYRYRTTAGVFYGTEQHRIVSGGSKVKVGSADSIDVISGPYNSGVVINPQDVMDGMVFGDGSVHKASNNLVYLYIGDYDKDYFNSEIAHLITKHRPGLSDKSYEINTTITADELDYTYNRSIPTRFIEANQSKVAGFLRGLFTANGGICGDRVALKTSSSKICEQVQLMLSSLGIRSYYTTNKPSKIKWSNGEYTSKESYDVNITTDKDKFLSIVGFVQNYKTEQLSKIVSSRFGIGNRKNTYDIISVDLVSEEEVFDITVDGESHTYWSGNCNTSNCGEASLNSNFCNLVTTNANEINTQEELNEAVRVATFISTLQAGYTDFHYLRDIWKKNTEKEALLGVSLTGIANDSFLKLDLKQAALIAKSENARVAKIIGINPSARITLNKPEGTASLVVGSASGAHAWYSKYYIRRIRVGKNESIYHYLVVNHPELVEDDYFKPNTQAVISIPVRAPEGAIFRDDESPIDLLERVKRLTQEWIKPAHRKGDNTHSVSCTVEVKEDEWDVVRDWMWNNIDTYNCLTVLPWAGGTHKQAPFEAIDEDTFNKLFASLKNVDLSNIVELDDETDLTGEVACGANGCELK